MNLSRLQEMVEDKEGFRAAIHGVAESDITMEQQQHHGYHAREKLSRKTFLYGRLLCMLDNE